MNRTKNKVNMYKSKYTVFFFFFRRSKTIITTALTTTPSKKQKEQQQKKRDKNVSTRTSLSLHLPSCRGVMNKIEKSIRIALRKECWISFSLLQDAFEVLCFGRPFLIGNAVYSIALAPPISNANE